MTALWTSEDIAAATGGTASAKFSVSGLSIDTRSIKPGDLFIPLKDARDGHEFLDQAFANGASGALSEIDTPHPHVRVANTMDALRALGRAGRERCQAKRIAVTGSVGKTSVKDALGVMLGALGKTHISQRSFNNHYGVPITLATLPQETEFAVFETGMNHAGELTDLSAQVAPHIALITNVEAAHMAHFSGIEAIADAKAEIASGLMEDGVLILNADKPQTPRIRETVGSRKIVTFGRAGDIAIVASNHHATGGNVRLRVDGQQIDVTLSVSGAHWDYNAAACIAVAHVLGLDLRACARALRKVGASTGRGDVTTLSLDGKSITLIDQSYNANPASMRAAFAAASLRLGRKVALLGDMKELGATELDDHAALAGPIEQAGFARVIMVGECMRALRGALPQALRGPQLGDVTEVLDALRSELEDGDTLLIKGSNSTGLSKFAGRLKADFGTNSETGGGI